MDTTALRGTVILCCSPKREIPFTETEARKLAAFGATLGTHKIHEKKVLKSTSGDEMSGCGAEKVHRSR